MKAKYSSTVSKAINETLVQRYQQQIEQRWKKTLESIFEIGNLLLQAKSELKDGENDDYQILLNRLSFGPTTATRIASIASDPRFKKKEVKAVLPPCWTTLEVLQRLTPRKFKSVLTKGLINPGMTREEARLLVSPAKHKAESTISKTESPKSYVANMTISTSETNTLEASRILMDIKFFFGLLEVVINNSSIKSDSEVRIQMPPFTEKLSSSEKVLLDLITSSRNVENYRRSKRGLKPLNKGQEVLSLLGLDIDSVHKNGLSVMEALALQYARKQGITCIKNEQLNWFSPKKGTEAELLGSFLTDVEQQVDELLTGRQSKKRRTRIVLKDANQDSPVI